VGSEPRLGFERVYFLISETIKTSPSPTENLRSVRPQWHGLSGKSCWPGIANKFSQPGPETLSHLLKTLWAWLRAASSYVAIALVAARDSMSHLRSRARTQARRAAVQYVEMSRGGGGRTETSGTRDEIVHHLGDRTERWQSKVTADSLQLFIIGS